MKFSKLFFVLLAVFILAVSSTAYGQASQAKATSLEKERTDDLLVVIDMQNVYLEDKPWACTKTTKAAENIKKLLGIYHNVVFTKYVAPKKPTGTWVTYNETYKDINDNKYYEEIIDQLKPYSEKYPCYEKSTYSSYGSPEFKKQAIKANRMIITGVVSECCILATVIDAIDTGVPVTYVTDACTGGSEKNEKIVEDIVALSSPIHTELVTTQQLIEKAGNK